MTFQFSNYCNPKWLLLIILLPSLHLAACRRDDGAKEEARSPKPTVEILPAEYAPFSSSGCSYIGLGSIQSNYYRDKSQTLHIFSTGVPLIDSKINTKAR
jgi:hypothetical protein